MDIIQVVLIGIIATLLYFTLQETSQMMAVLFILCTVLIIFVYIVDQLQLVLQLFMTLANRTTISSFFLETMIKIIGIAYIAELGANITRDAGLSSVASKIELAGKLFILLLAVPIIQAIIDLIFHFMPMTTTG